MSDTHIKLHLVEKIRELYKKHCEKAAKWREEAGLSEDFGCVTRESSMIVAFLPEMTRLGLTLKEIVE